ncbi:MAG: ABC transporter permease [Desulfobacterales bacterium]|nr:ABC transporter permease [Desulfobacterales bacterium]
MRAKRKQVFVSIITFISIFGIFLGVAALIIVLAVMNGFEEDLRTKILGIRSHIEVTTSMYGPMKNYPAVREEIDKAPGVVASTPFIYTEAMMRSQNGVTGVIIRGMDTQSSPKVINLGKMREGSIEHLNKIPADVLKKLPDEDKDLSRDHDRQGNGEEYGTFSVRFHYHYIACRRHRHPDGHGSPHEKIYCGGHLRIRIL